MGSVQYVKSGIVLLFVLFLAGCAKESTTDPATGDSRSKFIGNWLVSEQWNKLTYEVTISADNATSDGVFITNFSDAGTGISAYAFIQGNSITLTQDEHLSNGWVVNGGGTLSGTTKITWSYTRNDGADLIYATAVYTKN
jgi:hypothetical protein